MRNNPELRRWWDRIGSRKPDATERQANEPTSATTERIRRVMSASWNPRSLSDSGSQLEVRTQQVGDREFQLVGDGLPVSEVNDYVKNLLERIQELEKQRPNQEMVGYVERLMSELAHVEENIKNQTRREAEAAATLITAEAKQKAQQAITKARDDARQLASQEAEGILAEAKKRAEIVEGQVRVQSQLLLAKSRAQIEDHIRQQSQSAYNRMIAALNEMVMEAARVEADWKLQTGELMSGADGQFSLDRIEFSTTPIIDEALGQYLRINDSPKEDLSLPPRTGPQIQMDGDRSLSDSDKLPEDNHSQRNGSDQAAHPTNGILLPQEELPSKGKPEDGDPLTANPGTV